MEAHINCSILLMGVIWNYLHYLLLAAMCNINGMTMVSADLSLYGILW